MAQIPKRYQTEKITKSLDRKALLEDLKQGKVIPGVFLKHGTRLNIG